ncbi:hypothetical protein [Flagellimonas nanhaiensis]|uniref:Uncharacterized protein n=1 Tax=Flagellimonas nanhaiensis TaxID=2292706 RepID=A0A371JTJ7_9FLAO|nr:hypothetical protein [Allomuricauda nanhaiensis]RDY61124.1 hypothetical protein DX873_02850 [Allomuricauda nanhaiensis]
MKTVFIIFMVLGITVSEPIQQEEFIVEATYIGIEEGAYTFVDDDGLEYEFSDIDIKASKKYDLDSNKFLGRKFQVTYWMETEIGENDEEYDVYIIVSLDLVG